MAISTIHAYLIKGEYINATVGTVYQFANKLVDIKDYPTLGGPPDMIETTTLSEIAQTHIRGVESREVMEFTCNYTPENFAKLIGETGVNSYQIWFGKLGEHGKFGFSGESHAWVNAGDVNGVIEIMFNVYPSVACDVVPKAPELLNGTEVITKATDWQINLSTITKLKGTNKYYGAFEKRAFLPRLGEYFTGAELQNGINWFVDSAGIITLTGSKQYQPLYVIEVDATTKKVVRASKTIIQ